MSGRSRERATLESRSQSGFGVRGGDRGEQAVLRTIDNAAVQAGLGGCPWNSARRELAWGS